MTPRVKAMQAVLLGIAQKMDTPVKASATDDTPVSSYDRLLSAYYARIENDGVPGGLGFLISSLRMRFSVHAIAPMDAEQRQEFYKGRQKFQDICLILGIDEKSEPGRHMPAKIAAAIPHLG